MALEWRFSGIMQNITPDKYIHKHNSNKDNLFSTLYSIGEDVLICIPKFIWIMTKFIISIISELMQFSKNYLNELNYCLVKLKCPLLTMRLFNSSLTVNGIGTMS